jgi:hypothetical protein
MVQSETTVERFFRAYEHRNSAGNTPNVAARFADTFLAAGPQGAKCVRAEDFAPALSKRKQLFESLGCQATELVFLDQIPLDARYVLARTRWQFTFVRGQGELQQVLADSVFILDTATDPGKIILYLANQDIMQVLKERGIMAA